MEFYQEKEVWKGIFTLPKWRALYLLISWDYFTTTEQKANYAFDVIKLQQQTHLRRDIKPRRQRDLVRDMYKEMIFVSLQVHGALLDLIFKFQRIKDGKQQENDYSDDEELGNGQETDDEEIRLVQLLGRVGNKGISFPFVKKFRRVIREIIDLEIMHIYDIEPSEAGNQLGVSIYQKKRGGTFVSPGRKSKSSENEEYP